MNNVAIITARGGSKRIPRKNIKSFLGKPIILYSIEAAIESGLFEKVIVSTDDSEIAAIAKQSGAEVPFLRSEANSDDFATTVDVLLEVVMKLNKLGLHFENVCCIYPTAPFTSAELLLKGYDLLKQGAFNSIFSVCKFGFPIYRALTIDSENRVEMIWPENMNKRSQDLPTSYHDAGQFYWIKSEVLISEKKLYTNNSGVIVLNELQVQDIDNIIDWKLAELKYQLLYM